MPPFLSKVFFRPRKKDQPDASKRRSDPSLLEGKFERVSSNLSPVGDSFSNELNGNSHEKEKEKEGKREKDKGGKGLKEPFSLLRSKPTEASTSSDSPIQNQDYFLSLNIPGPKGDSRTRPLGVVFEGDADPEGVLSDAVIGRRRLSPQDTLALVRACSQEIMTRGLETLGIMHPYWYSASPETQRRTISLFIQSLATNGPSNTLPTDTSPSSSSFNSQISSARPHDIAAVLRWAIRHLQLEGTSFGNDQEWYRTFFDAERNTSYPPRAFSEKLVSLVPKPHFELLNAILAVLSSLAAHAETNSISGSKLSMLLGLCLLTSQRSESGDDWQTFYSRWEQNGRMLEHLFLAQIRDEAAVNPVPKRLTELVRRYPYSSTPSSDGLLARPRFSTLRYEALFVRVESELPYSGFKPTKSLTYLLQTALKAELIASDGETKALWEKLRQAAAADEEIDIHKILSDDTVQLFSLVDPSIATSPTFKLDIPNGGTRRRSLSLNGGEQRASPSGRRQQSTSELTSSPPSQNNGSNPIGLDWSQFSTSGFLDSGVLGSPLAETLMDKDVEVTKPHSRSPSGRKSPSRKSSERRGVVGKGRKSLDALPPITIPVSPTKVEQKDQANEEESTVVSRATQVSLVKLDEAFVDFWADALSDPISESWPRFAICRLVHLPGLEVEVPGKGSKALEWLIVEQKYVKPTPPPEPAPTSATETISPTVESARPTSPRPSMKSIGSSAKKRFTFWSSDKDQDADKGKSKKKKGVSSSPKVGEMGEILKEEDEIPVKNNVAEERKPEKKTILKEEKEKEKEGSKAGALAGASALVTGIVAAGVATGVTSGIVDEDKKEAEDVEPAEEKAVEVPEEVKIEDEGDESKTEAKLPVSESAPTTGAIAVAGVTSGYIAEDEKKETEPLAVSDAQVNLPYDSATTKVLVAAPTEAEEHSKPVDEAEVPVPVETAAAERVAEPVPPGSVQADEVFPPGLARAEIDSPKPVENVETAVSSEPAQATEDVASPVETAVAEEVAEPVPSAVQAVEDDSPRAETVVADEEAAPAETVAPAVPESFRAVEASPVEEAEVTQTIPEPIHATEEVVSPVERAVAAQTTAPVDPESVGTVEEVSPPVETADTVVEEALSVDVETTEEAGHAAEDINENPPVINEEEEVPTTPVVHTSDASVPPEAEHIEETPVQAVTELPAEEVTAEVQELPASTESKLVSTNEEPQSHPVANSKEKAEVESETTPEQPDDPEVLQATLVEEQKEEGGAVPSELQVPSSDVPEVQPSETQDETNETDLPPTGTQTDVVGPVGVIDTKDDEASPAYPEDSEIDSVTQRHVDAADVIAIEDAEGIHEAEEAKQVTPENPLEGNREDPKTDELIEPVKEQQDVIASNGYAETPEQVATVEGADIGEKAEAESPSSVEDVSPQVPVVDDDEGAKGIPVLVEDESQAPQLTDEMPPVESDTVQAEAASAEVAEEILKIADETSEPVESEALQQEEVEVPDETLGKKPEDGLVHTELLHDNSTVAENAVSLPPVPIVEAEAIPPVEPTSLPDPPSTEPIATRAEVPPVADNSLPSALASVILSGGTPGPEIALSSNEPAVQQLVSDPAGSIKEEEPTKEADSSDHEKHAPTDTLEPVKDAQDA